MSRRKPHFDRYYGLHQECRAALRTKPGVRVHDVDCDLWRWSQGRIEITFDGAELAQILVATFEDLFASPDVGWSSSDKIYGWTRAARLKCIANYGQDVNCFVRAGVPL